MTWNMCGLHDRLARARRKTPTISTTSCGSNEPSSLDGRMAQRCRAARSATSDVSQSLGARKQSDSVPRFVGTSPVSSSVTGICCCRIGQEFTETTGCGNVHGRGRSSTGSRPTAMNKSARSRAGRSRVPFVSTPAHHALVSGTTPLALYVTSAGT